jgi:hypothetical protein
MEFFFANSLKIQPGRLLPDHARKRFVFVKLLRYALPGNSALGGQGQLPNGESGS